MIDNYYLDLFFVMCKDSLQLKWYTISYIHVTRWISTGIIDILQRYNTRKFVEHAYKASYLNEREISCVDPEFYAERFIHFCIDAFE